MDFKQGWISILALFLFYGVNCSMKVYFISGLAADSRVFKHIQLPSGYQAHYLDWITPLPNESLKGYALRLSEAIDIDEPFVIAGLSMGGMIATEIANIYQPAACILFCSVPSSKQFPLFYKWAFLLKLHKLVPVRLLKKLSMLNRGFTPDSKADKELLKQVIHDSNPVFISWALDAILGWKNETIPKRLWHIHGSRDSILPIRFTNPTHIVKGGNHLMVMSKARDINLFLEEVLLSKNG